MDGVLIERDSVKRIFQAVRRIESEPIDITRKTPARKQQSTMNIYKGYFKAKKISADTIKIVDGMDEDSGYCGYVQCNKLTAQQIESPELTITENCYIFRKSVGSYTDGVLSSAEVTFEILTDFPTYTAGTKYELKSVVTFADGAITNCSDMPLGYDIDITGDCST